MSGDPLDIVEDALRSRSRKVTRRADDISACCPAHDDNNPSLSVSRGSKRDIVVCCHAGCTADDVMTALGLLWTDLGEQPHAASPRIVTTYNYVDLNGEILYRVARYQPKDFRPQHLAGSSWTNGYPKGVDRVLYNLPAVAAAVAAGQPVYVVEGEKDVDAGTTAGIVATTSPGGAQGWAKVARHAAATLTEADVIIVADDDPPGEQYARDVAASLHNKAKSITVTKAAPGFKDLADHLGAGHTVEDLTVIAGTHPDDPPLGNWINQITADSGISAPDLLPEPTDWQQLFSTDHDVEWLVEDVWPHQRQLQVFAARKTGKSLVMLWMAIKIAEGRDPFTGHPAPARVVIYLDYEMTGDDLRERLEQMGYGPDNIPSTFRYYLLPNLPPLNTRDGGQRLMQLVERDGAEVVVLDTLSRVVEGEENSNDTFQDLYLHTGLYLKRAGVALARLDHEGHEGGRARGASAKADDVDINWQLRRTDGGYDFVNKGARVGYVADRLSIVKRDEPLSFSRVGESWPPGTKEKAAELDAIGAPIDITKRQARELLHAAGKSARNDVLLKAIKYRQIRDAKRDRVIEIGWDLRMGPPVGTAWDHPETASGTTSGTSTEKYPSTRWDHRGDHRGPNKPSQGVARGVLTPGPPDHPTENTPHNDPAATLEEIF